MTTLPIPAQYMLRIDDLCPTVDARRWERLRALIQEFSLRPILAVVPANQDRYLDVSPPDPGFWDKMRTMEAAGAATALHGYTHVCNEEGNSLIRLHRHGEFNGLPLDLQRLSIARGLGILRENGLDPRLFVAPRHCFDWNTLRALKAGGICHLSDGFARVPFDRGGVTWIPMQLWSPVVRSSGLWTICLHPNSTDKPRFEALRTFLSRFASQFTSFDRVQAEFQPSPLSAGERLYERIASARLRLRRLRSQWRSRH